MCKIIQMLMVALTFSSSIYAAESTQTKSGSGSMPTAAPMAMSSASSSSSQDSVDASAGAELDDSLAGLNASFAEVAALGQQISLASKQIEALQMQKQLDALKTSSSQKSLGFRILRIEGFGSVLYAIFQTDSGGVIQVGPGEKVNESYRVALITSNTVKVVEIKSGNVYTVPFYSAGSSGSPVLEQPKQVRAQTRS